jgi:hypothetical protein
MLKGVANKDSGDIRTEIKEKTKEVKPLDEHLRGIVAAKREALKSLGLNPSSALRERVHRSSGPITRERPALESQGGATCVISSESVLMGAKERFMVALEDLSLAKIQKPKRVVQVQVASLVKSLQTIKKKLLEESSTEPSANLEKRFKKVCRSFLKQARETWEGATDAQLKLAQKYIETACSQV